MGRIKSALELAMERTENLSFDAEKFRKEEKARKAKALAGKYLEDDRMSDAEFTEAFNACEKEIALNAINSVIVSNLTLPNGPEFVGRNARLAQLFSLVNADNVQANQLFPQILGFEQQYWEQTESLLQRMKEQLKDAIEQSGIPAEQNKDFMQAYQNQLKQMVGQYNGVLEGAKNSLRNFLGLQTEEQQ